MPKLNNKYKKSDFYNKYGFDIGDIILILPKNDGRSISNFKTNELNELISKAQKGIIKYVSGHYMTVSKDGVKGPFYERIHIECEDGDKITCNPIYYRLYGRFDSLGLNNKQVINERKNKTLKGKKLLKDNEALIKKIKDEIY